MKNIRSDKCYDSDEYLEMTTGNLPAYKPSLDEVEAMHLDYWNYPLTEIDHIIENELKVVLVRFPECYGGYEYRFCEVVTNV